MRNKDANKYYLYAGYYELWISNKRLRAPLALISWHKSLEAAQRAAEKYDDWATVILDADLLPEIEDRDAETQFAEMAKYAA